MLFRGENLVDPKIEGALTAVASFNLDLNSTSDNKPVRINSRNFVQASNNSIGFQSKPNQTVTTTGEVIGGEISPRLASGVGGSTIKGLHVDVDLKGTAAGDLSGDVRGLELELVTTDAGTRDITGNVNFIRMRSAFSGGTISGKFIPIRIEKAEAQTNSKQYDAVLELPDDNGLIWSDDYGTEPSTAAGAIKVRVGGADRWIQLYSGAPVV